MPRKLVVTAAVAAVASVLTAAPALAVSGGTPAAAGSYGFVAKISMAGRSCTGALIAPLWIATAADCFPANPQGGLPAVATAVTVGAHTAQVVTLVARADRNLTLAKLDTRITDVTPVAVRGTAPSVGESLRVAGYGRTETDWVPDTFHTNTFSVAGNDATTVALTGTNGSDTCRGDAGGPAFTESGGVVQLVGVNSTSWQHGCLGVTETRQGTTDVRTDDIAAWITQQTGPAQVTCTPAAVWDARADGSLWRYQHNDPAGGTVNWVKPQSSVGSGWLGRTLAGPGGVVWDIHKKTDGSDPSNDGDLKRWVWNGQSWSGGDQVGSGWQLYLNPANANQVTVDSQGRIYQIDAAGALRVFIWNTATNSWVNGAGQVLDTNWGQYNSITAAGDGVLYARTADGHLYRYQYSIANNIWQERAEPEGTGWQIFPEIFSPGADILYGRGATGPDPVTGATVPVVRWYRNDDNTNTWSANLPDGRGKVAGTGFYYDLHVSADPSACTVAH